MAATTPRKAPARRAVKSTQSTPATFDFEAFLAEFQRPEFTASLMKRADLTPKLLEKQRILDDLDERIDRLERAEGDDGIERDITAVDALSTLTERRNRLTADYNELAETYNASAVNFTFRTPDGAQDQARIQALMAETGLTQPVPPEKVAGVGDDAVDAEIHAALQADFEQRFAKWWDALAIRSMTVTCIAHPGTESGAPQLTLEQWEALRARVGPVAFNSLGTAWFEAVQASAPTAPFLPRPLPTRETDE